jgi:single-strand DNA-binding protein
MVTTFSVAVRQPKRQGEDPPAYWVKVEVWGKTAEYAANYLKKGDSVFCAGTVTMEEFTKRDGTPGFANVLKNANVEKFSSRDGAPAAAAAAAAPAPAPAPAAAPAAGGHDDDIPF